MAALGRVELIGYGYEDLEAHASVLRHFWSITTVALDSGQMPTFTADLMVVSDSIPEPQRQVWVDRVRSEQPALLVVRMNGFDSGPHLGADATVDESHGPGALVATIYELLTERGLASRNWPHMEEPAWVQ